MKKELTKLVDERFPYVFNKMEEIAAKNGGHFLDGKASWADVYFTYQVECMNKTLKWVKFRENPDVIGKFPNLKKLYAKTMDNPGLKKWVQTRPREPFFDDGKEMPLP